MKPAPVFEAVTAVLTHGGDLYLARRQPRLTAFPGYHAFPGGKVDADDPERELPQPVFSGHVPRLMHALSRELQEELGFDLIAAADQVESVRMIGRVLTPETAPVRFNTHFFRVDLRQRPDFTLCEPELESGAWGSPKHWMSVYQRGELLLAPPTLLAVQSFAADPDSADAGFAAFDAFNARTRMTRIEALSGVCVLLVRSNTIPPALYTNCFLLGDSHRILVDPSPNSEVELERLYAEASATGFDEVFLTHHHPDHREFADVIARRAGVPMGMSRDTLQRIRAASPGYAEGVTIKRYGEGDVVTRWLDQPVRVLEVPGHDEGQLALMPDNRAWCIVGDLIQGVGTVVISPPEGDMRKYFASLARIIGLQPRVIFPSHGLALGGVHYLEQALRHREMREEQIRSLFGAGRSIDEMLAEIYRDVPAPLLPLARINIESHLAKLRQDGVLG
jgi:glyoxylase-like metal-dependent hydrolase (beta-lactamase superfamily II)/8-oxo-dGTP pyrophosphatase MutT (NUDIX family)